MSYYSNCIAGRWIRSSSWDNKGAFRRSHEIRSSLRFRRWYSQIRNVRWHPSTVSRIGDQFPVFRVIFWINFCTLKNTNTIFLQFPKECANEFWKPGFDGEYLDIPRRRRRWSLCLNFYNQSLNVLFFKSRKWEIAVMITFHLRIASLYSIFSPTSSENKYKPSPLWASSLIS